jgi:hypothetical protein
LKFLFKIHSGFDGFQPKKIPERLISGRKLELGWDAYLDSVEMGDEVWVYFHGPHQFDRGVYAKGFVTDIDFQRHKVVTDRDWLFIITMDGPLYDLARLYPQLPAAFNPDKAADAANKIFI